MYWLKITDESTLATGNGNSVYTISSRWNRVQIFTSASFASGVLILVLQLKLY